MSFFTSFRRAVVVSASAIALVVAVAGCTAPVNPKPTDSTASSSPPSASASAGDCWVSGFASASRGKEWRGGRPIPCVLPHQLFTYGIVSVYSTRSSWATADGDVDDTIASDASSHCYQEWSRFLPSIDPGTRLSSYYFLPSKLEWKKGARWVRCDVGVLKSGSSFASPELARLPANISVLKKQVKSQPDLFGDCVLTTDPSGSTGPYDDPKATVADCTGTYQWQYDTSFRVPYDDGTPYPTDEQWSTIEQSSCGVDADSAGRKWTTYVPTSAQWTSGERWGECWFYRVAVSSS